MEKSWDEIVELFAEGAITAISLDTEVFVRHGLRLNADPLSVLKTIGNHAVSFVLSEIVRRELEKRIVQTTIDARQKLESAIKNANESALSTGRTPLPAQSLFDNQDTKALAEDYLATFLKDSGAIVLPASTATLDTIVDLYFLAKPPFDQNSKKKHEFPDAIALLGLETWAKSEDTLVLVVSHDTDWKGYCLGSPNLILVDDFPKALSACQKAPRGSAVVEKLRRGALTTVVEEVISAVNAAKDDISFWIDCSSYFHCEEDYVDVEIDRISLFNSNPLLDLEVINESETEVTLHLDIWMQAKLKVYFNFYQWDSVDREEISMGSSIVNDEVGIEGNVYLTLGGNLNDPDIIRIEIDPITVHRSYENLEPDWMHEGPD